MPNSAKKKPSKPSIQLRPAVFLDRDGTISQELGAKSETVWKEVGGNPEKLRLLPGAGASIRRLNEAGFIIVIISNQSGVARGFFDEAGVRRVNEELSRRLKRYGAHIAAVYYCPHHPSGKVREYTKKCACRKPSDGMFRQAARELKLDFAKSFAMGDNVRDLTPAKKLGCKTALVLTGKGKSMIEAAQEIADIIVPDISAATSWILKNKGRK